MQRFDDVMIGAGEVDHREICVWLKEMAQKKQPLSLVNFYMEMPVGSQSVIAMVDDDTFTVSPSETHIKVLTEKQKTIIKMTSELWILANCQAIDTRTGEVFLAGFRYINLHADRRESCRVRLYKPINVALETENGKMSGILKDISIGGCRVNIFMKTLQPGDAIKVSLKMFDSTTNTILNISVAAELIRADISKMPVVCNLHFVLDAETEDKLIYFINQRQIEVMKCLKDSLV